MKPYAVAAVPAVLAAALAAWSPVAMADYDTGRDYGSGQGADTGQWTLITSNLLTHYRSSPEHNNRPALVGLEYSPAGSGWLVGGATFRNSFAQRSQYGYLGRRFDMDSLPVYAKLTGGVLQGYRGEHRDKIPFNRFGLAPAIVPSVGVQVNRFSSELLVLGNSALALTVNYDF